MAASVKDVAAYAGVSEGTVSNTLNRPSVVRPATREKVLRAIEALGFVPDESARALRVGRSRVVGFVADDVSNPFYSDVARGAENVAYPNGTMVMICNSDGDTAREAVILERLVGQRVQGLLITPLTDDDGPLDRIAAAGTAVVVIGRRSRSGQHCSVHSDDRHGGRLAVEHLWQQGHRRLAFVGPQFHERLSGVQEFLAEQGADPDELLVLPARHADPLGGRSAGDTIAAQSPRRRVTAVLCGNDVLAIGVLQAMTHHGLRVPDDVAIVGYDDIDAAAGAAVPLTSIRQPRQLIGATAAEMLLEEITPGSGHVHRDHVFEPELVTRRSSAKRRPVRR
ncbi:LacI family transcriptional regulator [Motilibacter peucedani]|uniref:LacI family transcriptional regulator n=1 Tax=Motilibacter peucedani TaxID=598650 RepID=A0A420XQE9_9ACTN|nr:LacI family DNA-binding transcriptional regulator [Motilibacter peucedani]RKS75475.1 LacI family transcriptional regulator [Motilibacter peucedani]